MSCSFARKAARQPSGPKPGETRTPPRLLATGGMVSSILALVMLPLVTRFYSPEVYAQFAIVLTLTIILATVATGKYEQAIPLCQHSPAGELEARQLARLATGVASIVCLALQTLTVGIVLLFDPEVPGLETSLLAIPVLVMLGCLGVIQSMILRWLVLVVCKLGWSSVTPVSTIPMRTSRPSHVG